MGISRLPGIAQILAECQLLERSDVVKPKLAPLNYLASPPISPTMSNSNSPSEADASTNAQPVQHYSQTFYQPQLDLAGSQPLQSPPGFRDGTRYHDLLPVGASILPIRPRPLIAKDPSDLGTLAYIPESATAKQYRNPPRTKKAASERERRIVPKNTLQTQEKILLELGLLLGHKPLNQPNSRESGLRYSKNAVSETFTKAAIGWLTENKHYKQTFLDFKQQIEQLVKQLSLGGQENEQLREENKQVFAQYQQVREENVQLRGQLASRVPSQGGQRASSILGACRQ